MTDIMVCKNKQVCSVKRIYFNLKPSELNDAKLLRGWPFPKPLMKPVF